MIKMNTFEICMPVEFLFTESNFTSEFVGEIPYYSFQATIEFWKAPKKINVHLMRFERRWVLERRFATTAMKHTAA